MIAVWFSCGAASAAALKLTLERFPGEDVRAINQPIKEEHPDNRRFLRDVEEWTGRTVEVIGSDKYETVDDVFEQCRYMAGIAGARCTVEMKKRPREAYQRLDDIHLFGYTADEFRRAERFEDNNPDLRVEWMLIDHDIVKRECLAMLDKAGIRLPEMYRLGFDHNNCIGCVKATSPTYWQRVHIHFPEVFARRVRQSRLLHVRLAKVGGERVFLDELKGDEPGFFEEIECGPVCQGRF